VPACSTSQTPEAASTASALAPPRSARSVTLCARPHLHVVTERDQFRSDGVADHASAKHAELQCSLPRLIQDRPRRPGLSLPVRRESVLVRPKLSPMNIAPPAKDPLGEILHYVRMSGIFYCRCELTEPWALELSSRENCVSFHVVTAGVLLARSRSRASAAPS
jgi:hypothetical protein